MAQTVLITGASSGESGARRRKPSARKGWNVSATARNPVDESIWGGLAIPYLPDLM